MRIAEISIILHRRDVPRASYRFAWGGPTQVGVVTVTTDEGLQGNSFLGSAIQGADELTGQVLDRLAPILLGRDPLDIGALWQEMWARNRFVTPQAICSLDVALWDILGKAAGLPIHRLLGTAREAVPAYASSAVLASPEAYAEEALAFRDRGWTAYKIHPQHDPTKDLAICRAVKRAVGDSLVLMLDAMWAYRYEEALRVGLEIQDLGFYWYEDPLADDDLYGYVKLKEKLAIPILATEWDPGSLYAYAPWILQRATDMLRGDVYWKGGITPMMKIGHLAEAFRMPCEIHHGSNSLNNVANLHATMALPNCEYFEVLLPDATQKYGLVQDIEVDRNGLVHAPTSPGLGYAIDWELIRRNQTAVLTRRP